MIDLWPAIDDVPKKKSPNVILEEQGLLLKDKTNNIIQAEIKRSSLSVFRNEIIKVPFIYEFYIKAPLLRYKYNLFSIAYDIFMYPTHFDIDRKLQERY